MVLRSLLLLLLEMNDALYEAHQRRLKKQSRKQPVLYYNYEADHACAMPGSESATCGGFHHIL